MNTFINNLKSLKQTLVGIVAALLITIAMVAAPATWNATFAYGESQCSENGTYKDKSPDGQTVTLELTAAATCVAPELENSKILAAVAPDRTYLKFEISKDGLMALGDGLALGTTVQITLGPIDSTLNWGIKGHTTPPNTTSTSTAYLLRNNNKELGLENLDAGIYFIGAPGLNHSWKGEWIDCDTAVVCTISTWNVMNASASLDADGKNKLEIDEAASTFSTTDGSVVVKTNGKKSFILFITTDNPNSMGIIGNVR